MRTIKRVAYCRGLMEDAKGIAGLPTVNYEGGDIPAEVLELIECDDLLECGGIHGDPDVGDPVQYDHLLIEHDQGVTEITVYNRGIMLFMTEDETIKRVHRVCCKLGDLDKSAV